MNAKKYLFPVTERDIVNIFQMVRGCSYISENYDYRRKAELTQIEFVQEPTVNAYAQSLDEKGSAFNIVIYKGICDVLKLGSLAMAEFTSTKNLEKFVSIIKWTGNAIISNGGDFSEDLFVKGVNETHVDKSSNNIIEAKSYLAGALIGLIGHEIGHICLSHVVRGQTGNAISRNDERSADLFACSVSDSTPFTRYSVLGDLVMSIIFSWLGGSPDTETTHPDSRERVYNMVNSHREYLKTLGISKENIDQFLP